MLVLVRTFDLISDGTVSTAALNSVWNAPRKPGPPIVDETSEADLISTATETPLARSWRRPDAVYTVTPLMVHLGRKDTRTQNGAHGAHGAHGQQTQTFAQLLLVAQLALARPSQAIRTGCGI